MNPMIQLLQIDCMDYMATLPDGAFDLAIVDPPYGRGEDGGTNRSHNVLQRNGTRLRCVDGGYAKKNWDNEPPPPEYFHELRRVSKHQIIWGGDHAVYIDWRGDVRVIQDASAKQKHRGRDELLGWYRKGIGIELIEDDLLTWLRASSARAAA